MNSASPGSPAWKMISPRRKRAVAKRGGRRGRASRRRARRTGGRQRSASRARVEVHRADARHRRIVRGPDRGRGALDSDRGGGRLSELRRGEPGQVPTLRVCGTAARRAIAAGLREQTAIRCAVWGARPAAHAPRGAQDGHHRLLGPQGLDRARRVARSRGAARGQGPATSTSMAARARAPRRHDREVHRRRDHGGVRAPEAARGRRAPGGPRGATGCSRRSSALNGDLLARYGVELDDTGPASTPARWSPADPDAGQRLVDRRRGQRRRPPGAGGPGQRGPHRRADLRASSATRSRSRRSSRSSSRARPSRPGLPADRRVATRRRRSGAPSESPLVGRDERDRPARERRSDRGRDRSAAAGS